MLAQKDLKSGLIRVKINSSSASLSQQMVVRAVGLLDEYIQTQGQTQSGVKAAFASKRLEEAKIEALASEMALSEFTLGNRNFESSPDPSIRLRGARLVAELGLHRQIVMSLSMTREQALMDQKDDTPIINVLDAGSIPLEKSGPPRGRIVLGFTLLAFFGSFTWANRLRFAKMRYAAEKGRVKYEFD